MPHMQGVRSRLLPPAVSQAVQEPRRRRRGARPAPGRLPPPPAVGHPMPAPANSRKTTFRRHVSVEHPCLPHVGCPCPSTRITHSDVQPQAGHRQATATGTDTDRPPLQAQTPTGHRRHVTHLCHHFKRLSHPLQSLLLCTRKQVRQSTSRAGGGRGGGGIALCSRQEMCFPAALALACKHAPPTPTLQQTGLC